MRASGRPLGAVRAGIIGLALVLAAGCSALGGRAPGASTATASGTPASRPATMQAVAMPPDLAVPAEPRTCAPDLRPGWLRRENGRPLRAHGRREDDQRR